jgi:hypothetical protein
MTKKKRQFKYKLKESVFKISEKVIANLNTEHITY